MVDKKKQEKNPLQNRNLRTANPVLLRELAKIVFLDQLKLVPKLTKLKLIGMGVDVDALLNQGHLVEERDSLTGICYYSVVTELPNE
jgi:hypothetical protein